MKAVKRAISKTERWVTDRWMENEHRLQKDIPMGIHIHKTVATVFPLINAPRGGGGSGEAFIRNTKNTHMKTTKTFKKMEKKTLFTQF